MATARTLITRALRKSKVLARSQSPTASEANDGLTELNAMLGLWSNSNMLVYARVLESYSVSTNSFTIGSGGDFNTARPIFIAKAYIRDSTTDYPVDVISEEAYANIQSKSLGGRPESLSYDNGMPLGTINLYPSPSTTYTLFLLSEKQLTSIATLDTTITFPPGWDDVIVYNLALRFFAEYGTEPDELTYKIATDGMAMIERTTRRARSIDWGNAKATGNLFNGWFT